MAHDRSEREAEVRALLEGGDVETAATRALELYGEEIGSYLGAFMQSDTHAADVFSQWGEDVWRGLPSFQWGSSLRTWCYTLARNAGHRFRRSPANRPQHNLPMEMESQVARLANKARDSTALYLKTKVKDRMRALRERLPEEDQVLLVLRVDRNMDWEEVASVLLGEGDPEPAAVKKKAAALRKRFERLKAKLRTLAEEEGLLPRADDP
jgi:RNA polymerase sigma-70 factor (ECF subfamily)